MKLLRRQFSSFPIISILLILICIPPAVFSADQQEDKRLAIVTLVTTSTYIPGALVLGESLRQVQAKGEKIVLWVGPEDEPRSDMNEEHIQQLEQFWDKTMQLSKKDGSFSECKISEQHKAMIDANPKLTGLDRYWGTCSKFAAWGLTDYDVVVYMDADSIAFHNFDFVFDYLDEGMSFAAHPVPECYDTDPPDFQNCNFYTAFFVLKPLSHVQKFFQDMANKQWLAEGEITLLNQVISLWKPLPRFTLVAQTETVRPTNPSTGQMDTSLAKVYDFAGSPDNKPWESYRLAKEKDDPNWHAYFGSMRPGTEGYERYMVPQKLWNECYDRVLKKLDKKGDEL